MKIINKKKAQTKFVINALILLAGFVITVSLVGMFLRSCEKSRDLRGCHDDFLAYQIAAKELAKVNDKIVGKGVTEQNRPWPESCKTQGPIEIKDKDPEVVKRKIANMLVQCWWSLGRDGKEGFDPFSKAWVFEKHKCFPCYYIKLNGVEEINAMDFNFWLIENHLDSDPEKLTYWNYFRGTTDEDIEFESYKVTPKGGVGLFEGDNMYVLPIMENLKKDVYYAIIYHDSEDKSFMEEALSREPEGTTETVMQEGFTGLLFRKLGLDETAKNLGKWIGTIDEKTKIHDSVYVIDYNTGLKCSE